MGLLDKLIGITYHIVPHMESQPTYTHLNTDLKTFYEVLNHFQNNKDLMDYKIVKFYNPNKIDTKITQYYTHFFLQLYIDNYNYNINFPFTNKPLMGDSYIRFIFNFEDGTNLKQYLTNNATIKKNTEIYKKEIIPEKLQKIDEIYLKTKFHYFFESLTNSKKLKN